MKNRVVQFILLAGLVSCAKNFDSLETTSAQFSQPSVFVSSDTTTESDAGSDSRTYVTRTYWITSVSPVNEGANVTIKMNTTNVTKGTTVPYTITGIDAADITAGSLSGNFTIGSNGTDSVKLTLKADQKTEGTEVIKVVSKSATLSISVNDNSNNAVAAIVTGLVNFVAGEIPLGDIDLLAPGRGANTFYTYTQTVKVPDANTVTWSLDNDVRFTWIQLQPSTSASTYDWSVFDSNINYSISKGQRFSFRVMTLDTDAISYTSQTIGGNKLTYPPYLHNQMQAEGTKDWLYNGSWIPNWNSPSYLSAWETFLKALASHINSGSYNGVAYKNVIYKVDISGFGNYSEFHSYPFINNYPSTAQKLTDASFKRIVDAHITAFPTYPLMANVNMLISEMSPYDGWYALTASNAWGKLGFRSDHMGDNVKYKFELANNTRSYNGMVLKAEVLNRWKTSPIAGEPMNGVSDITNGGSCAFWDLLAEVNMWHMSQFSNTSPITGSSCADNNFRAASKAAGYRLSVKGGSVSGKTITLNWSNVGNAPVYENWDTYLEVRSGSTVVWSGMSSFKPKLFLPGTTSVNTTIGNVTAGNYSLYVIVKDPTGYRKPLTLSNTNRGADGAYKIADIKI